MDRHETMRPTFPTRRVILGAGVIGAAVGIASYRPISDPSWKLDLRTSPWRPRDSAGLVVQDQRLWLIGGTLADNKSSLLDCWSSPDGLDWSRETDQASWNPTIQAMTASFAGRLWRMGGFFPQSQTLVASAEVWASRDGRDWQWVSEQAPWTQRGGGTLIGYDGKLWLLGGSRHPRGGATLNDVWCTEDGSSWTQVLHSAPWRPRAFHSAVVHDGQLWVIGGGEWGRNAVFYSDVWSTSNGFDWRIRTEKASWAGRLWAKSVSYKDLLWTMGGLTAPREGAVNDVWYSGDGQRWYRYLPQKTWSPRMAHCAVVFDDRVLVLGGSDDDCLNDVWTLGLDSSWFGPKLPSRLWSAIRST